MKRELSLLVSFFVVFGFILGGCSKSKRGGAAAAAAAATTPPASTATPSSATPASPPSVPQPATPPAPTPTPPAPSGVPGVDLTVAAVRILTVSPAAGDLLDWEADVLNLGTDDSSTLAPAFAVAMYLDQNHDSTLDRTRDRPFDFLVIQNVPAGGTVTAAGGPSLSGHCIPAALVAGTYDIFAQADAGDHLQEFDETNNVGRMQTPLTFAARTGPDLCHFLPLILKRGHTVAAGDMIDFDVYFGNVGDADAVAPNSIFWYLWNPRTRDYVYDGQGGFAHSAMRCRQTLPPGHFLAVKDRARIRVPAVCNPGKYFIVSILDVVGEVNEYGAGAELNNVFLDTITVK